MPVSNRRHRPTRAIVSPLVHAQSIGNGSTSNTEQFGFASAHLWDRLSASTGTPSSNGSEALGMAIIWPEEKRLKEKRKRKSLVIWVKKAERSKPTSSPQYELSVPEHLIPPFSSTPLTALIQAHDPIELSLVVLQPVIPSVSMSDSTRLDTSDLDFTSLHASSRLQINGHANGHGSASGSTRPARIIRQDETISIPRRTGSPQTVRVLTQDPVQQGIITRNTRIVVATTPHVAQTNATWTDTDGAMTESSHGKTHLSMANFDPDAFLSSSLDLHFSSPSRRMTGSPTYESTEWEPASHSSTSGSITPRPNGFTLPPHSPPAQIHEVLGDDDTEAVLGTRFNMIVAQGPPANERVGGDVPDVCWMGVAGLGRAGIFEGDWVYVRADSSTDPSGSGRLLRAAVWERLGEDEDGDSLPANPILITPSLSRALFGSKLPASTELYVSPTPFGAREPTLPIARTMTLARIATAEGVDKRYERACLKGLQALFAARPAGKDGEEDGMRMVKRGDVFSIPVWKGKPVASDETLEEEDSSSESENDGDSWSIRRTRSSPTALAYFIVSSLSYEPLNPLDEDFRSTTSSKARAGELGCWVDAGTQGATRMVLTGIERAILPARQAEQVWHGLESSPAPFNSFAVSRLRGLLSSCLSNAALNSTLQLSILVKGARGSGKTTLIRRIADEVGLSIVELDAYNIVGDPPAHTEGSILASLEKVKACAPAALLLRHVEALSKKADSGAPGRPPAIVRVLEDAINGLRTASGELGFPCLLIGTTGDVDATPGEVLGCFKQEVEIGAPNERERSVIASNILDDTLLDSAASLSTISAQSAALQANDIASLIHRAQDILLERTLKASGRSAADLRLAELPLSAADIEKALGDARASYSDSIGAPKIPNVRWEDVGGLANVKKEILETVQLPLERPELFAQGLKKRSGILLYGPPGTGKTLLAKAVATSCSLNFFSVKGPELLNMYIGESEANVRRVFQRARDASPCIIFMDELDSVAPKRGNQGDSGGVMDRIVSQLLAELDGMSSSGGGDVFVMGATNRPDLLDPALLRPGRFDRMLYLSVATTNDAQQSILEALTRKFKLEEELDLGELAEACPFNYTGADFYALCSDAMLRSMTRKAEEVDRRIEELNASPPPHSFPHPLTPHYYLASMASKDEVEVRVSRADFLGALEKLVPSVSKDEMDHYARVQEQFKGYEITAKE